jgi:hypothetical protein
LISRITNFFLDDSQANVDAGPGTDQHCPSPVDPNSAQKPSEQKRGAGLKVILVSGENPDWMVEQLSSFHRIDIGAPARKFGGLSRSASRAVRRPPTLASVAARLIHKQSLDRLSNSTGVDVHRRSTDDPRYVMNQSALSFSNDPNTNASIPTQPSTSTTNAKLTATPAAAAVAPTHTRTPSLRAPPSAATNVPQTRDSGSFERVSSQPENSSVSMNSDSRLSAPEPRPAHTLAFELDACPLQPPESDHVSISPPLLPPLLPPRHSGETQPYDRDEKATGYSEDENVEEDEFEEDYGDPALRLYIESSLEEFVVERQCPTDLQSYIVASLEAHGDGSFLWLDFAIEEIRKVNFSNMGTVLDTLPASLAEMYAYILCNITPNLANLVAGLLRWTVCAHRPLNVLELTVALKLSNNSGTPGKNLVLDAVRACGNMLTVSSQDDTVNTVHRSVVDF